MTDKKTRRKKKPPLYFVATCGFGLEELTGAEIKMFGGIDLETSPGAISWSGDLESGYLACLWSRFASRILLRVSTFKAMTPDALYQQARRIDWDDHFDPKTTFAVFCTLSNANITHSRFAALKVKDAIVDQFRTRTGRRPDVDSTSPSIRLQLHIQAQTATLYLDLSGESLHRRGYRTHGGRAPIKETLAAAIVKKSGFDENVSPETILLDPMCGSGTILIEAAMIYGDIAPGLQRKSFGFMAWHGHNKRTWDHLVEEAIAREDLGTRKAWPRILGFDADRKTVEAAKKNIENAGLEEKICVETSDLFSLGPYGKNGFLVVNPPYGERLSDKEAVKYLYRSLGRICKQHFSQWKIGLFTSNPELADMLQIKWGERLRFYNGPIKCGLFLGQPGESKKHPGAAFDLPTTEDRKPDNDLGKKLLENFNTLSPWAQSNNITCFRIYDNELPEYNLKIDIYEKWLYVQECQAGKSVDPKKAKHHFNQALGTIRKLFGVGHSRIFFKSCLEHSVKERKTKGGLAGKLFEVNEQHGLYLVNFTDYPGTGLSLDQRLIRNLIYNEAKNKRFLNLFGYTGAATVSAARGGASSTTTVDISEKYLAHARANLALNGFGGRGHNMVSADCLKWLNDCPDKFDLILVTLPGLSGSSKQEGTFHSMRSHDQLLRSSMKVLTRKGLLIFSTGSEKFDLSLELTKEFIVDEITSKTLPNDFKNSKPIRRCWELRHPETI